MILRILRKSPLFIFFMSISAALCSEFTPDQVTMQFEELKQELQSLEGKLGNIAQEEITFEDINIKEFFENFMSNLPYPSETLKQCYEKVCQGAEALSIGEVMEIIPELLEGTKEHVTRSLLDEERAPRPNATSVNAPNAIVGKSTCDLTQVLGLLAAIKKRIQEVLDCLAIIKDDFNITFSELDIIIEDLQLTLSCLAQIKASLACFQTTEISGPTTITEPGRYCVTEDIDGTITIAADKVILDVNSHTIGGATNAISISPSFENIFIKNGFLDAFITNGVSASDARNLVIEDTVFSDGPTGINIITSTCIIIKNCIFKDLSSSAITIDSSDSIIMNNIKAHDNVSGGELNLINLNNTRDIFLHQYGCTLNTAATFRGVGCVACRDIIFSNLLISNNTVTSDLAGIFLNQVIKGSIINSTISDNTVTTNTILSAGINMFEVQDLLFENVSVKNILSSSGGGTLAGIIADSSFNTQFKNCTTSNIQGDGLVAGFDNTESKDLLYDQCISTSNVSNSGAEGCYGFLADSSEKAFYIKCISNNNIANADANGFALLASGTSCVLNSIAKQNSGGSTGRGIFVFNNFESTIDSNLASGNIGGLSSTGIEVSSTGGILANTVISNKSSGHGTTNYVISPGTIPLILYIRAPFFISATPTDIDNFDIR